MKTIETHRQAILTRYHFPTNTKGARISAQYAGGRRYYSYDHGLNISQNHAEACARLVTDLGWDTTYSDTIMGTVDARWYGGTIPSGDMVWVSVESEND